MEAQPEFGKILRINLLIVVAGAVLLGLLTAVTNGTGIMLFAIGYLGQVLLNVILGFVHLGKGAAAYFLSALLVLLIGFGSCTGMLALLGGVGSL